MKLFGLNLSSVDDSIRYLKGDPSPGPPGPIIGRDGVAVPDRTTPIIAWRAWRVTDDPVAPLMSANHGLAWPPYKAVEAMCTCEGSPVTPKTLVNHDCGIYAAKNLRTALEYYSPDSWASCAIGQVKLWGRVVLHSNDIYRAVYAYPAAFVFTKAQGLAARILAEWLAEAYGVDADEIVADLPPLRASMPPLQPPSLPPASWPQALYQPGPGTITTGTVYRYGQNIDVFGVSGTASPSQPTGGTTQALIEQQQGLIQGVVDYMRFGR